MKSTEVYSLLRHALAPPLKELGFTREKPLLSWSRREADDYIVIWCQVSRDGFDPFAGSQFVVELQRSEVPVVGASARARKRIGRLLSSSEREHVRILQNQIIRSLSSPPSDYALVLVSAEVASWYRAKFVPVDEPYGEEDDIWFRYSSRRDVESWAGFLAATVSDVVQRFQRGA